MSDLFTMAMLGAYLTAGALITVRFQEENPRWVLFGVWLWPLPVTYGLIFNRRRVWRALRTGR